MVRVGFGSKRCQWDLEEWLQYGMNKTDRIEISKADKIEAHNPKAPIDSSDH
jgi:endogenous inhibitor of DNA gyrase (YacG/DUF329 family)